MNGKYEKSLETQRIISEILTYDNKSSEKREQKDSTKKVLKGVKACNFSQPKNGMILQMEEDY